MSWPHAEERFEVDNYLLAPSLGQGNCATVYLFIPIQTAHAIYHSTRNAVGDRRELEQYRAIDRIQAKLRAVKLQTNDPNCSNMIDEVRALHWTNRINHPNLVFMQCLYSGPQPGDPPDGYALEYFPCGTLEEYTKSTKTQTLPVAFAMHLVHQMSSALLALQFGVGYEGNIPWPGFSHGDVEAKNMFFRNTEGASPSSAPFPDIILGDFGSIQTYDSSANETNLRIFWQQQYADVRGMLKAIFDLFNGTPAWFNGVLEQLDKKLQSERKKNFPHWNEPLQKWLENLCATALRHKTKLHRPLQSEASLYFQRETIPLDRILELLDGC